MAIRLYDSKDAVPEAQREGAIETKDGKWAAEEVGDGGRSAIEAEREARRKADQRATDAENKRKEAEARAEKLEQERKARESGVSEEALQKIRDEEAKTRKPIEEKLAAVEAENRKLKLDDRLRTLYLSDEIGGMPDRVEDAMLVLKSRADLGDKDGLVFKDKDGKVTADDAPTFFKKLKEEKKWMFKGSGSSGSGSHGSDGGGGNGGFDPVAAGKAAAEAQKKEKKGESLAFR